LDGSEVKEGSGMGRELRSIVAVFSVGDVNINSCGDLEKRGPETRKRSHFELLNSSVFGMSSFSSVLG